MPDDTVCPNCGTDDHVTGERDGDLIQLSCSACNTRWARDPSPRCPTCGGADMELVPQAVVEKSRGTQLSISFINMVPLCRVCDATAIATQRQTNVPLAAAESPVLDPETDT